MKIAIFGGTFNPVHNEHVNLVRAAKRTVGFDKVIVMPTHITPLKSGAITASAADRLNMCRLAFKGVDGASVSDYEIKQGGVSYSYLTCRALKQKYPDDELYFIIGADMLEAFANWKNPEEILKCVKLLVCARENKEKLKAACAAFKARFGCAPQTFDYVGTIVSSTRVRALAALGETVGGYTDKNAADYIYERSLYKLPRIAKARDYFTQPRWRHVKRVAVTAAANCARLGIPEETAVTAAALHDIAKYLAPSAEEFKGFTCPEGVPEPVVHQYAGAYVAEHTFGITDKDILNAIRYHTSGRENMSPLEKLIFLSDLLEEDRDFDGVKALREIFARSVDECMYAALEHQLKYLEGKGESIYPLTYKAFEYLKENKNGQ